MKANTLNILSGKGGSGKTIIALSISKFLSELQYKVLLIDCDVATHGATYFFEDEIDDNDESKQVSLQNISKALIKPTDIINISKYFDFIPSTTDLKNINEIDYEGFISFYKSIVANYDIIIFDNQAGYSNLLNICVDLADKNLIVLETDTISSSALRSLYLKLGEKLSNKNTQQIFNKLTEDERDVYANVVGGTLFPNLPPIPFDWKGRTTFALGQIPSIEAKDSAFGLGILRIVKIIFQQFVDMITEYEKRTIGDWFDEITTNIDELEKKKKDISSNIISRKDILFKFRFMSISTILMISSVIIIIITIPDIFSKNLGILNDIKYVGQQFLGAFVGLLVGATAFILSYFSKLKYRQDKELEEKRIIVNLLDSDLKKYKTLIETDPQLREYYKMEMKKTKSDISKKITLDKSYYVNKSAPSTGEHEVHTSDCNYIPEPENRTYLGKFDTCQDAINKAKEYYINVDGCYYCARECHTR